MISSIVWRCMKSARRGRRDNPCEAEWLPAAAFTQVIYSALRTWPPAKVYEEFSLLTEKKGASKAGQNAAAC
jgi:hypothetical protein